MANLSISAAWSETAAYVRREGQLLFPIAFLLLALPGTILQALMPQGPAGGEPEIGSWAWLIIPVMLISLFGYLTLCWLAVRRSGEAGSAFSVASSRLLPLLGAVLLLVIALVLIAIPIVFIAGGISAAAGGAETAAGSVAFAAILLALLALVIATRLFLIYPVAAAERVGPIEILRRSWNLTRGHFWKLLGFLILIVILFAVVAMAVGAVAGLLIILLAGAPEPGSVASFLVLLVGAVVNTLFVVFFAVLISRIYAQLAGAGREPETL